MCLIMNISGTSRLEGVAEIVLMNHKPNHIKHINDSLGMN